MTVQIVTDSSGDLSPILAADLGITIVPANILFGREKYRDGVDINPRQFYDKLGAEYFQPMTTPASPLQFYKVFREIEDRGDDILMITLPVSLSGFQVSAKMAAAHIEKVNIEIYSSGGISGYQSIQCIQAAELAKMGYSIDEIVYRLTDLKKYIKFYALVPSFNQLIRSGRIPGLQGKVGGILGIYPLLTVENEELVTVGKPKGFKPGFEIILNELKNNFTRDEPLIAIMLDGYNPTWASRLGKILTENFNIIDLKTGKVGPTIGANAGAGTVGVAISPVIKDLIFN